MTVNHYAARKAIDTALISGGDIRALCGEHFTPSLRVGSGGKADDPGAEICAECQALLDLMGDLEYLRDERDRLNQRIKDAERHLADARREKHLEKPAFT
ncbi:DUF3039 domain-containing protein [Microbacterium sp. LMI1x-1-1.1]|uniref:DUF3039 domain-containing protein n=1 Tax=Microbacterium sp. LMI1x-1-1.1 TaxID=3135246 RepID=UPI00341796AB